MVLETVEMTESLTFAVRRSARRKELTYSSFPVKLYRLTTSKNYCSIWWSEDGTHIVVDVPRFEQEILRSATIPEADGFKTITFTSFIRQLNLYGFRKVSVDNDHHVDPRDWQRYAHAFFIRSRTDYLERIRRQPGPFHCRMARASGEAIQAMRSYNEAVARHFQSKGLRPSRKGPKPTYTRKVFRATRCNKTKKKTPTFSVQGFAPYSMVPYNMGYMSAPHVCVPHHQMQQPMQVIAIPNDSNIWAPTMQMDLPAPSEGVNGQLLETQPGYVTIDPSDIQLSPEQWESLSLVFQQHQLQHRVLDIGNAVEEANRESTVPLVQPQCVTSQPASSSVVQAHANFADVSGRQQRGDIFLHEGCVLPPGQDPPNTCHFDQGLAADVLSDDVVVTSSASRYCVDAADSERIALWDEGGSGEQMFL